MRNTLLALAALAVLLGSTTARANEEEAEGGLALKLGVGAGYGFPLGNTKKGEALSNLYAGEIPVEIEATYRFAHAISAGVYAGYGAGLASTKAADVNSISTFRFGLEGEYEFERVGPAVPFAALRTGYVTESIALKDGGGTVSTSGWEYFTAILGADFEPAQRFAVGPFVSFALGQYTTASGGESILAGDRRLHEWLTVGLRGTFGL